MMPEYLQIYWTFKDELSTFKVFVLLKYKRIVVPRVVRAEILNNLHIVHQGIVRIKKRARATAYWPEIDGYIESIARGSQQA